MTVGRQLDSTIYLVQHGRAVRSRLPTEVMKTAQFVPSPPNVHSIATLRAILRIATRCAPWLRVYVGPQLWIRFEAHEDRSAFLSIRRLKTGDIVRRAGGQAWEGMILVSAWTATSHAIGTVHHEIWHAIENELNPEDLLVLNREVSRGVYLPGEYLSSLLERRARAYDSWASARSEGWEPFMIASIPVRRVDRIWNYVYTGKFAADRIAGHRIKPRLWPGQALARSTFRAVWWIATISVEWPFILLWPMLALMFLAPR